MFGQVFAKIRSAWRTVVAVDGTGDRSEFLPGPKWRARARPASLWAAVLVTFGLVIMAGGVVLWFAIVLLDYADAPGWLIVAGWMALTFAVLGWALRTDVAAIASDYEDQAWSEYAVRAVMVGRDQPRSSSARMITAVVFGAPLAVGLPLLVLLAAVGVS